MSIGKHQSARMKNDEWLTPPHIIELLGPFDLDPCSPVNRPWDTALLHYNKTQDGLSLPWKGRIWCNPPYGKQAAAWLERMVGHDNGIALMFARTETQMFFRHVWDKASAIFFFEGRLHFHYVDGSRAKANAGAPHCLIAYGQINADILSNLPMKGKYVDLT